MEDQFRLHFAKVLIKNTLSIIFLKKQPRQRTIYHILSFRKTGVFPCIYYTKPIYLYTNKKIFTMKTNIKSEFAPISIEKEGKKGVSEAIYQKVVVVLLLIMTFLLFNINGFI